MARIALLLLLSLATVYLCQSADLSCGQTAKCKPHTHINKKFALTDEMLKGSSGIATSKNRRTPRQATPNEQRQYYPCMTCFKLGSREVCTNPYCPSEDFQCDKASKRCHKKARVGANRPASPSASASDDAAGAADDA